jgi:hypothetical protein
LDLGARAETVQRVEEAFLVELASETDAALIAHDSEARKYCRLAGAKHVALAKRNYRAFRNTIKKLGSSFPMSACRLYAARGGCREITLLPVACVP